MKKSMFYESFPIIFANAKRLRTEPTSSEEIFWNNDKVRDEFMQPLNLKTIRFTNDEVCTNGERVVKKLKDILEQVRFNQNL